MENGGSQLRINAVNIPIVCADNVNDYLVQWVTHFRDSIWVNMIFHTNENRREKVECILHYSRITKSWHVAFTNPFSSGGSKNGRIASQPPLHSHAMGTYALLEDDILFAAPSSDPRTALFYSSDGIDFQKTERRIWNIPKTHGVLQTKFFANRVFAVFAISEPLGSEKNGKGVPSSLYVCENPAKAEWQAIDLTEIVDNQSQMIQRLEVFNHHLYVAVTDIRMGFQLWKTDAKGKPPYVWKKVLDRGALRYTRNNSISQMVVFHGHLYLSTTHFGGKEHEVSAGSEILRIHADDCWQLIVGEPRFSPCGLQVPHAIMGPGFDKKENGRITGLAVYENTLFASVLHPIHHKGEHQDDLVAWEFRLWGSKDGETWQLTFKEEYLDFPDPVCGRSIDSLPFALASTGFFTCEIGSYPNLQLLIAKEADGQ